MPQSEDQNRAEFMKSINRCADAFNQVNAQLPENSIHRHTQAHLHKASLAYLSQLPILFDPQSFQIYIACIAHGASIGAIDPIDVGRFCHLAQTAMSAWKLANLTATATQKKEKETYPLPSKGNQSDADAVARATAQPSEEPQNTDPLPTNGNHIEDRESRGAPEPALSLSKACHELAEGGLDSETRDGCPFTL